MAELTNYHIKATDWRAEIHKNQQRTNYVIALFILIYLCVGLLVDLYLHPELHQLGILGAASNLLSLQTFPTATFVTVVIAIICLWITFTFGNKLMLLGTNSRLITLESAQSLIEKQLYHVMEELQMAAGLRYLPKIYIIEAPYMNAFASGYSEKSAMVAITRGLLDKLDRAELQAVMAHELSHIRHQDIKLTMTASVLTNIILIVIDLLFRGAIFGVGRGGGRRSGGRDREGNQLFVIILLLRFLLPIITLLLMLYLSRKREFMADAGCVELTRDNMPLARALIKINDDHQQNKPVYAALYNNTRNEEVRRAAYIYDPVAHGVASMQSLAGLFSSHPTLNARLRALGVSSTVRD